jgi:hypothetical protein
MLSEELSEAVADIDRYLSEFPDIYSGELRVQWRASRANQGSRRAGNDPGGTGSAAEQTSQTEGLSAVRPNIDPCAVVAFCPLVAATAHTSAAGRRHRTG